MSKTFTVNVPDQLWVDSWTENKTESYTYDGPSTWNVLIDGNTNLASDWSEDPIEALPGTRDVVVTLDATDDSNLPVAHYMHTQGVDHEYTVEDETNHDEYRLRYRRRTTISADIQKHKNYC